MYPKDFPTATEHNYDMNEAGRWQCSICGHTVKIKREGVCIGVPIFKDWDDIPDTMNTKTTLNKKHGLKVTKDQIPVGAKKQYNHRGKETGGFYPLYALADAKPKKQPTKAQLAALEKAQYMAEKVYVTCTQCNRPVEGEYDNLSVTRKQYEAKYTDYVCRFCKDEAEAIEWAQSILKTNAYILDTETSDLDGEIIEIAIIDMQGNTILNQRIKPQGDIAQGAYQVHGISLEDLKDCPPFDQVYENIKQLLSGREIIIYNADFDIGRLWDDCERHELTPMRINATCAMEWYAQYIGDWSSHWGSYKWQRLEGDHSALGDCKATLEVIKTMAHQTE